MEQTTMQFLAKFARTIAPRLPRHGNTIKVHRLVHVPEVIMRLGALRQCDAQFFESTNRNEKVLYKTTNGRSRDDMHLGGMVQSLALREVLASTSTFDPNVQVAARATAYLTAAETGEHTLAKRGVLIPLGEGGRCSKEASKVKSAMGGDFAIMVRGLSVEFGEQKPASVFVVSTGVLAAAVPWLGDEESELHTVRATHDFHRRPYYDSVAFPGRNNSVRYGQLRVLFTTTPRASTTQVSMALIRCYAARAESSVLSSYGCTPLKWSTVLGQQHTIVPFSSLLYKVYVVPDFHPEATPGQFHLCPFKWNRKPIEGWG